MKLQSLLCRVLGPQGKLLSITFAQPHFRRPFFAAQTYDWSIHHLAFGETFHYFVYILCRGKKKNAEESSLPYEPWLHALQQGLTHEHMDQEDYLMAIDLE